MRELQLVSHQQPGEISIENFQELHDTLSEALLPYQGIVYTEELLPQAKADKKELSRLRREIEDRRKDIKRVYMTPYNAFEQQIKELLALVDEPLEAVKTFVSELERQEKEAKRAEIEQYFRQHSSSLGAMTQQVWESPAFLDPKWLNKTTTAKTWQAAVDQKVSSTVQGLQNIQTAGGNHIGALTAHYLETLDMEALSAYQERLYSAAQAETAYIETNIQDNRTGSKVLRLSGNIEVLNQALELLRFLNLDCEILEDDTPQPMLEHTVPDFDSFVAFDLETTGTNGAANGDTPSEITEIGAVRVENGKIVDKFSTLVNPGRKILPRISRITGITDEMVAGAPDIESAIRQFMDFVGGNVLVGHNIKGADLHYIDRALKRTGVRMENAYFDTYSFARELKAAHRWESIKLEYLAQEFGVTLNEAHRAWCDAEATACLYLKMREL